MIKILDLQAPVIAEQVLQLQRRSYQIEAELIQFDGIPPLRETLEELQRSEEIFIGYYLDDQLAGFISYQLDDQDDEQFLDICRLAVAPAFFRRGIAKQLLQYVLAFPHITRWGVMTGAANQPAIQLYEKLHFQRLTDVEVEPGVWMARFLRE